MKIRSAQQQKSKRIALVGLPRLQRVSGLHNLILAELVEELGWNVVLSAEATPGSFRAIGEMDCDGAIVRVVSEQLRREATNIKCPMVNISAWLEEPGLPSVIPNGWELGRLAAEHLRARGYRSFGCVISTDCWLFASALSGVEATVRSFGGDLQVFRDSDCQVQADVNGVLMPRTKHRFQQWIRRLKIPAALVLVDDRNASVLMEACREAGLSIPADIAVISTTYHQEYAHLCTPALTSVLYDDRSMIVTAVRMLQKLMAGKQVPRKPVLISPIGVIPRESTAFFAVNDRRISRALEFIHANYQRCLLSGSEIAEYAGLSRSVLGRFFKAETGSTVHDYVIAQRMRKAQELLETPNPMTLRKIAILCGFRNRKEMNRIFRRLTGNLPRHPTHHQGIGAE